VGPTCAAIGSDSGVRRRCSANAIRGAGIVLAGVLAWRGERTSPVALALAGARGHLTVGVGNDGVMGRAMVPSGIGRLRRNGPSG
jgi:hypothetical protein